MISAKELLEKGNCKGITCSDCPLQNFPCENAEDGTLSYTQVKKLQKMLSPQPRITTLRERLEEYEKAHRALWQECKDDINAMFEDSGD